MTVRRRKKAAGESQSTRVDSVQPELRVVNEPDEDRLADQEPDTVDDDPFEDQPFEPELPEEASADPFEDEVPVEPAAAAVSSKPQATSKWAAKVPQAWGNVVHDVFAIDIDPTFKRLVDQLTVVSDVTQYGNVLHALEASSRNAFDAARLVRAAKIADDAFGTEVEQRMEQLRSTARAELEKEKQQQKAAKGVAKAPTLQEISDRVLFNWPDEVRDMNRRKGEMHGAFRAIEGLEKAWWDRCQTLRKIADRFTNRSSN